jgi:hypothetical protein
VFNLDNVNSWGMFGVILGYVVFFRVVQYLLFASQTGHLKMPAWKMGKDKDKSRSSVFDVVVAV